MRNMEWATYTCTLGFSAFGGPLFHGWGDVLASAAVFVLMHLCDVHNLCLCWSFFLTVLLPPSLFLSLTCSFSLSPLPYLSLPLPSTHPCLSPSISLYPSLFASLSISTSLPSLSTPLYSSSPSPPSFSLALSLSLSLSPSSRCVAGRCGRYRRQRRLQVPQQLSAGLCWWLWQSALVHFPLFSTKGQWDSCPLYELKCDHLYQSNYLWGQIRETLGLNVVNASFNLRPVKTHVLLISKVANL